MAVFCSIIAGIFCLNISYPAQPAVTARVDTNGLAGSVQIQGAGWHVNLFSSDALVLFDSKDARHVCIQNSCLDFRRRCADSEGRVHCVYDLNAAGGYLTRFTLDADNRDTQSHAARSVGLFRGDDHQVVFPLALLDQTSAPQK